MPFLLEPAMKDEKMIVPYSKPEETIVGIEYVRGKAFDVVTHEGGGASYYDFEWCKRDGCYYYHESGGGPADNKFRILPFSKPKPCPGALWVAEGIQICEYKFKAKGEDEYIELAHKQINEYGYRLLRKPLLLKVAYGEATRNPFEADAAGGVTEYCWVCDDRLPYDYGPPCEHLVWLSWGEWGGVGDSEQSDDHYKTAFMAVLKKTGLAAELKKAINARCMYSYEFGDAEAFFGKQQNTLPCLLNNTDYTKRFVLKDLEDCELGVAWLCTLQPGVTRKAERLTREWIKEYQKKGG
jgi:hypothetical protein